MRLTFTVPLKTGRGLNDRGHWATRAKRVAKERTITRLTWLAVTTPAQRAKLAPPFAVHLVRISPGRGLDAHDNLPGALKGCVDALAACLGLDDGDERVSWTYGQERGSWGVRVTVDGAGAM